MGEGMARGVTAAALWLFVKFQVILSSCEEAVRLYRLAAAQGNAHATEALVRLQT
jgi:TPR repeat protein